MQQGFVADVQQELVAVVQQGLTAVLQRLVAVLYHFAVVARQLWRHID